MSPEHSKSSSLRVPARWQVRAWLRARPGRIGVAFLLAFPLLLLLPIEWSGLFQGWDEGARVIFGCGAFLGAVYLTRDLARPMPEEIWLFQKGLSLADWGLARWLTSAVLAASMFAWWVLAWMGVALVGGHDASFPVALGGWVWLVWLFLLFSSVLFLVGAFGSDRGVEILILLLLFALAHPALGRVLHPAAVTFMQITGPPLDQAAILRGTVILGEPFRIWLLPVLRLLAYVGVAVGAGCWLLARRRPAAG